MTTTAAPCFFTIVACSMNFSSPTFREILLMIGLPWHHFKPASTISNFDESIMKGTFETSGSVTAILMNFSIAGTPSIIPSSTLMSITCAPSSTCCFAMSIASPYFPSTMSLLNLREPAMLHLSPTFRKGKPTSLWTSSTIRSVSPESHIFGRPKSGSLRGLHILTASWIASMCCGVDPQQPPIIFTHPSCANCKLSAAISAGLSS
mmetsp:Transcript_5087/g.6188  ORF Transcript_5087/g.6188 Transcript_5087/m.6188 type:complete len:206 (+) Transcript_5087:1351-1968(+)